MTATRPIFRALVLFGVIAISSCDTAHPSHDDLAVFLDAVQFGDVERVYEMHAESTEFGTWCNDGFRKLLSHAKESSDPTECERVAQMTASDLDALGDELRLAVQISRFVCENPDGTCVDYGRTVFYQAARANPLIAEKPTAVTVKRHFGDDVNAAAYVEFHFGAGRVEKRVLGMRKFGSKWRVHKGFLQ